MTQTITGLYDHYASAQAAVGALERMGVPHSDISIVAHGRDTGHASDAEDDAGKGAGIGAAIGGVGGLLTGLGMMAIPGVGPVVAAGWLVATVVGAAGGAAVGGAAGGLIGSMTNAGVNEADAHVYAEGVRRGGTLVTARVADSIAASANAVLHENKAVNPVTRGEAYRSQGWSRFDEASQPYSETETAAERARYTRV